MTREEIMELDLDALESRANAIALATDSADMETLETLNAELDAIEERKADIAREIETRKKDIAEVIKGNGKEVEVEERTTKMTDIEIRKSPEYLDAWVEYQKGRASEEQRALLTENAQNGTIGVPVYVEDMIHTAWESNEIVKRVRRTYFKGNLKVGVEISADAAQMHPEGGEAITEEELVIEYINLIPAHVKKMIRVSDEALGLRGEAFIDYLYDELEYQIVKKIGDQLVQLSILETGGSTVEDYHYIGSAVTSADIITAAGMLGGEATNPVLITTRATAAALKAAALSAGYAYDPYDGLEVIYVDSSALTVTAGGVTRTAAAVIADLSGWQINLPDGDQVKFKFDDLTEANADMVRIIGKLYVAMNITSAGKTVVIIPNA